MKEILYFSGSNSPSSVNQALVSYLSDLPALAGLLINLTDFDLPIYHVTTQLQNPPAKLAELKKIIDMHEAIVIAVPVHNGSVTAFFKNALDWVSRADKEYRAFQDKNIVLLSASPGGGCKNALDHSATILEILGGAVQAKIPITYHYTRVAFKDGKLAINDENLLKEITTAITALKN